MAYPRASRSQKPDQAKRYIDLGVRHFCIGWDRFIYQAGLDRIGEGIRKVIQELGI